jgi:hypothetical protein
MFKKVMVVTLSLLVSGFFILSLSSAPKKKACNDLKIDRCKERKECVWVEESKTKDGKTIKAYCKCKGKCE